MHTWALWMRHLNSRNTDTALASELEKEKAEMKAGEFALKKPGEKVAADRMPRYDAANNLLEKNKDLSLLQAATMRIVSKNGKMTVDELKEGHRQAMRKINVREVCVCLACDPVQRAACVRREGKRFRAIADEYKR